ncbi:SCO family protein [Kangiella koreensis]|uniref:Electron transport protein SCO1/SenC n=1 Tax=Kangiella koreensis (strain DSM 16069 / JCM 12317 / KCTC 12182 / SW-125) TaxID=523791 RepID=C7R6X6_KANKD|nr:SCO family protein [Kangiella koreensis]ACV27432.1 electron transport protein SCO1/SenC [Kangiella koreensis DSM 16069]
MKQWLQISSVILMLALSGQAYAEDGKASLPDDSIYHLNSEWVTQDEQTINIQSLSGKQQVVSLIYTHCMHTCPTIVATMQNIEKKLPQDVLDNTEFVLISLTPASDTAKVLKEFAEKRKLNPERWTLLTGDKQDVRSLAMALNIRYKKSEDNEVAHSNVFTLLDEQGRIVFQEVGDINKVDETVAKIVSR